MTSRTAWRWCAAAGIVAFICSWAFGRIPGLVACGPTGGLGPILAFEFVRTPADVAALFGSQPCTATLVAAQKTGLLLDGLGFIPSYTAFLILGAIGAGARGWIRTAVIAALIVAGVSDQIEGGLLYAILRDLPGTPALIGPLWWAVHVKFALLALGTMGISEGIARGRLVRRLFAALIGPGSFFALLGLISAQAGWMMIGFTIAWVALLLAAVTASFAPSLFVARAAPPPDPATPSA
jgi:hypothetical protein